MRVNDQFAIFGCILTLTLCFCTIGQLVLFLSSHSCLTYPYNSKNTEACSIISEFQVKTSKDPGVESHKSDEPRITEVGLQSILQNVGLLFLFGLQHSGMASEKFKNFLMRSGLNVFARLLYNCATCIVLQLVMYFWKTLPQTFWAIYTFDRPICWWLFTSVHFLAWLTMYSGCSIMDITELLGAKQVFHYINHWDPPLERKSAGLQRFYSHMRHPGFCALIVILFFHPIMQLDRIILGAIMICFMMAGFQVDEYDYAYQQRQLQRKCRDLTSNS